MTFGRAIRLLLILASVLIVGWSFFDVGIRTWNHRALERQRPITLQVLHWGNAAEAGVVETLVQQYERQNPQVRIVRIHTPGGGDDLMHKLRTMLAAGTPPDLFYLPPNALSELANLNVVRPIDDFLDAERRAGTAGFLEDFYPLLLKAWQYDAATQMVGRGKMYGLPKDFTTAGFYVNVDLFEKAGVKVPYDGWTWNEFEDAAARITALSGTAGFENRKIYGGYLQIWPATLRNILWTYGGDFFETRPDGSCDFRHLIMDQPAAQSALEMIVRTRLKAHTVYNATGIAKDGGQEFINGNIGCVGPSGRWMVPTYKNIKSFRWDYVPVPYERKEYQASQIYYVAWAMAQQTRYPEESYRLMKFLCGSEGARIQARLGLAIPPLRSVAESKDFLSPEGIPPHHAQVFLDAIQYGRLQQDPPEPEWQRIVGDQINSSIQLGETTPMQNVKKIESAWLAELDSPLRRQTWPAMRWSSVGMIAAGVGLVITAVLWWRLRKEKLNSLDKVQARTGWLFISPWVIGFLTLTLGPMIASLLLSFTSWSAMSPISEARAVGTANFQQLITADPAFYQSLKVTLFFVVLAVPVGQIASLAVALLMNSRLRGIAIFRTVYFLPTVISGVALAVLWLQIFNNDYGILNVALRPVAHLFGSEPPDWFGRDAKIWAIPALVLMGLWSVGGGMIIYLAGLKGIPASLYEAATIDGAGTFRQFWNVTLPMLSPLIFYNFIMAIIGCFQVFTQAYVMTGGGPDNATLFYVLNLYRQAFEFHNMGYASAMAWVLFLIVLMLTLVIFRGVRSLVYYEGLKS